MNWTELLQNPTALIALICIVGFVIGINLPLLFPMGLGKLFEREAKTWSKALRNGADISQQNANNLDELHRQVEALKQPPKPPDEQ